MTISGSTLTPSSAAAGPFGHNQPPTAISPCRSFRDSCAGLLTVEGVTMGINYGSNKVRFTSPVPPGSEIRAGATLASVEEVTGGVQIAMDVTVEIMGSAKPACVAQVLVSPLSLTR